MKELRHIRTYIGPLAEIVTRSKAGVVTMSCTYKGIHHRGVGLSMLAAASRLIESLQAKGKEQ